MRLLNTLSGYVNRLDAQGRIELMLIFAVLVAGALIASASFVMVRQQIIDSTHAELEVRAKFERREIEVKLASLLAQAGSLASNPATASTLANSAGRETDLLLFLRNQKLALAGATLTLTNVRGEMLVGSAAAAPAEDAEQQVVAAMMQAQASVARVQAQPAGALLKIAFPVLHRLSGNINWAVVLRVPLAGLTDLEASSAMLDRDGTRLSGRRPDTAVLEARAALDLPPPLAGLGLTYSAFSARDRALKSLDYLLAAYLSALALLALAALLIARFSTRLHPALMHKLNAAAESMAAVGHPVAAIPLRGDSEFDRLAVAFNARVERLAESYGENPVAMHASIGFALAHDLTHLLARAISKAGGTEWASVRTAVENIGIYSKLLRGYKLPLVPTRHDHEALVQTRVFLARCATDSRLFQARDNPARSH